MNFIIGGTGQVGQLLVKQLQDTHVPFRVLTHNAASKEKLETQGISAVVGDYTQPQQLGPLFTDVERVFLLTPSSPLQTHIEQTLIDAAKAAGVQSIVKLSMLAADSEPALPLLRWHAESEAYLKASGLQYAILRSNAMMQNFARVDRATIAGQSALYATAGQGKISFIDASDLAEVVVKALTTDHLLGKTYELTGAEAFSYPEVAAKFTHLLARPIEYVNLPDEAWRGAMISAGVPDWYADGLLGLYDFYRQGKGAIITQSLAQILGRQPATLESYLQTNRGVFTHS